MGELGNDSSGTAKKRIAVTALSYIHPKPILAVRRQRQRCIREGRIVKGQWGNDSSGTAQT